MRKKFTVTVEPQLRWFSKRGRGSAPRCVYVILFNLICPSIAKVVTSIAEAMLLITSEEKGRVPKKVLEVYLGGVALQLAVPAGQRTSQQSSQKPRRRTELSLGCAIPNRHAAGGKLKSRLSRIL